MRKQKGVELPINVLVIIAIAVIVLLGLIVLLSFGTAGANPILISLDKGPACQQFNCGEGGTPDSILIKRDISGDGKVGPEDTLAQLCKSAGACTTGSEDEVKKWCDPVKCATQPAEETTTG